jgi:hypothetical protein
MGDIIISTKEFFYAGQAKGEVAKQWSVCSRNRVCDLGLIDRGDIALIYHTPTARFGGDDIDIVTFSSHVVGEVMHHPLNTAAYIRPIIGINQRDLHQHIISSGK